MPENTPSDNRSMPSATVIPVLAYDDVRQAAEWLCGAFEFAERLRIGDHRAQLTFNDGAIIVNQRRPQPDDAVVAGSGHEIMARVSSSRRPISPMASGSTASPILAGTSGPSHRRWPMSLPTRGVER